MYDIHTYIRVYTYICMYIYISHILTLVASAPAAGAPRNKAQAQENTLALSLRILSRSRLSSSPICGCMWCIMCCVCVCVCVCGGQHELCVCVYWCVEKITVHDASGLAPLAPIFPSPKHLNLIRRLELLDERAQGDKAVLGSLALLCPNPSSHTPVHPAAASRESLQ